MASNGVRTYVHKSKNYTTIDNRYLRNQELSLKARGLLTTILSFPDDWQYSERGLTNILPDGRESVRSAIKELIDKGYLKREKVKDETGKFVGESYQVFWWREVNG